MTNKVKKSQRRRPRAKTNDCNRPTVEEIYAEAEASRQRWLILGMMHRELEVRFGAFADEPDLIRVGDGYQAPRRDVINQLRYDLIVAQSAARARRKRLLSACVEDGDVLDEHGSVGLATAQ